MSYIPILYILMLVVFISYVSFVWTKYGVQASISDSYYRLPDKLKFLFTLFCWGFSIPAMIIGSTVLMFLAGSAIAFVGAAAEFKDLFTRPVHVIGAMGGVFLSQLATIFDYHLWPISLIFFCLSGLILLFKKHIPNQTWWIEILAFISICVVLGIEIF